MYTQKEFARLVLLFSSFQFLKFLLLFTLSNNVRSLSSNRFCDEDIYFTPYIEVLKKRGGIPIKAIYNTGFLDLRNYYGVLLCINGPAYWYGELEYRENVTRKERNITVFKALANMTKIYEHECFPINRPEVLEVDTKREPVVAGMTAAQQAQFHKVSQYPTEAMDPQTNITGEKVYGIALFGVEGNYRDPAVRMFTEPDFGHNLQEVMVSSSFAMIGKSEFMCYDSFTNKTLVVKSMATTELSLCTRSEATTPFDHVLKRAHYAREYVWTLAPLGTVAVVEPANNTNITTTERPPPTGDVKNRMGQMLNPKRTGIRYSTLTSFPVETFGGTGSGMPGSMIPDANSYDPNFPNDFPEDFDPAFSKPHESFAVEVSDCQPFPVQMDKCTEARTKAGNPCEVLESALELKEITWAAHDWKKDILMLIQEIFTKVCPQISEFGAKAVGRLFAELLVSTTAKPKSDYWEFLITELIHCKNETQPMKFSVVSYGLEKQVLVPSLNDPGGKIQKVPRTLPDIKVEVNSGPKALFYYEEAVEVDYEFNIAIDSEWKMFSTVLGYCNQFYDIKKSSIFPRLYSMFAEDFLVPLQDKWTSADLNDVYQNVIGEMVSGTSGIWMDSCMEGSYLHSDAEAYRAMRPIGLADKNDTNHFITTPAHY